MQDKISVNLITISGHLLMSSFQFVQLSQTLNDIGGIFQILTLNGFGTK